MVNTVCSSTPETFVLEILTQELYKSPLSLHRSIGLHKVYAAQHSIWTIDSVFYGH